MNVNVLILQDEMVLVAGKGPEFLMLSLIHVGLVVVFPLTPNSCSCNNCFSGNFTSI